MNNFKNVIWILIGLPGSGKSYWSEEFIKNHHNTVCISRDMVRQMLAVNYRTFPFSDHNTNKDSGKWSKLEKNISNKSLDEAIKMNFDVILDETHITKKSRHRTIIELKKNLNIQINYVWFTENKNNLEYRMETPKNTEKHVWKNVIDNMTNLFENPTIDECKEFGIEKFYKVSRDSGIEEILFL